MKTVNRLHDFAAALSAALVACALLAAPAFAYVDPSVMTYTIQALAGVAVALSAVAGVALRRTRRALMRHLNIDENAGKNVEPVVHRIDKDTGEAIPNDCDKLVKDKPKGRVLDLGANLRWPGRFALAAVAAVLFAYTLLVVAPFEMVASNGSDLIFGLGDIWLVMLLFAVLVALLIALLASLLPGKAFDIAFAVVVAAGVCCWVQAMFLNKRLPPADGMFLNWPSYTDMFIISGIVWLLLIAAAVVLILKKRGAARAGFVFLAVALCFIQTAGLLSLSFEKNGGIVQHQDAGTVVTQEGLFDLSGKSNVVVFVLDMFDATTLEEIKQEDSQFLADFDGFTVFSNSTGSFVPTRYGLPYLLTGEFPADDDDWDNFVEERYKRSSLLKDMSETGYSIGLYTTNAENGLDDVAPYALNVHSAEEGNNLKDQQKLLDKMGTIGILSQCALYRDMPWVAKPLLWFYTDEINDRMSVKFNTGRQGKDYTSIPWQCNDVYFYDQLKTDRIELLDDNETGAFRLIHLEGDHWPYIIDENANRANTDYYAQAKGSLHIVQEYLQQMRDLGIYDEATVIITADHGRWSWQQNNREVINVTCPLLMVKASGSSGVEAQYSSQQTGHLDYPATLLKAMGGDWQKYGISAFDAPTEGRDRYFYLPYFNGHNDYKAKKWKISGNALDLNDWSVTDVEWECNQLGYGKSS